MQLTDILRIAAPIAGAFVGVGGIGAYYAYKGNKPKTTAEAQKINAEVVVTFAEGWRNYANRLEARLERNEKEVEALRASLERQDEKYRAIIQTKDAEIADLQQHNRTLEHRVAELELQLEEYKKPVLT